MREATLTELRNESKRYFDLVESGEIVRVFRNGEPIVEIHPIARDLPLRKRRPVRPLVVGGRQVSRLIIAGRRA
jgi:antitoxin (DNA-binding transcriptional repressor) of toxin-antitoxin stability system